MQYDHAQKQTIFPLQCPYIPSNRVHLGLPVCLTEMNHLLKHG